MYGPDGPSTGRPRAGSRAPARHGGRDRRRRLLPRLGPRRVRHRSGRPRRRRAHPRAAVRSPPRRLVLSGRGAPRRRRLRAVDDLERRLPLRPERGATRRGQGRGRGRQGRGRRRAASTSSTSGCGRHAGSSSCCRSCGPTARRSCPAHAVTPPGQTFAQWRVQARQDMERSEQIAAAVAFREAGLDVDATPRGALVEAVAIDVPAAKTLRGGDVIVEAAGQPVLTPGGLVEAIGTIAPGEPVQLRLRRDGKLLDRTVRTVAAPDDAKRAIIGIQRLAGREDPAPPRGHDRPRRRRRRLGRASRSRSRSTSSSGGTSIAGYRVAATGEIQLDGSVSAGRRDQAEDRRRPALGRGRLPRPGWGKREHRTPLRRDVADRACGEFSTGVARPANTSSEIADLQGFRLSGRHPQIAGDFVPKGVARPLGHGHNGRCSQGFSTAAATEGTIWASAPVRRATTATSVRRVSALSPGTRPCPTFRAATVGRLAPPPQPPTRASPSRRRARAPTSRTPAPKIAA